MLIQEMTSLTMKPLPILLRRGLVMPISMVVTMRNLLSHARNFVHQKIQAMQLRAMEWVTSFPFYGLSTSILYNRRKLETWDTNVYIKLADAYAIVQEFESRYPGRQVESRPYTRRWWWQFMDLWRVRMQLWCSWVKHGCITGLERLVRFPSGTSTSWPCLSRWQICQTQWVLALVVRRKRVPAAQHLQRRGGSKEEKGGGRQNEEHSDE